MRLLRTDTLKLESFDGESTPPYAILSHTWENNELSFQDLQRARLQEASTPNFRKVVDTCRIARERGFAYVWIDTCCIDKTSSAELSEAINSMFRWYRQAAICLAYLSDWEPDAGQSEASFERCRWFTRGWTLQELIAPSNVDFYDSAWNLRGTKHAMVDQLSKITGIRARAITDADELYCLPTGEKMSWASRRQTTRIEDRAYCLLGIFDVNIPLLYGEGNKAFRRLQEEIMRKTSDLSLLAWESETPDEELRGIWAKSPDEFSWLVANRPTLTVIRQHGYNVDISSKGLRVTSRLLEEPTGENSANRRTAPYHTDIFHLGCTIRMTTEQGGRRAESMFVAIRLRKFGPSLFVRDVDRSSGPQIVLFSRKHSRDNRTEETAHPSQTVWLQTEDKALPFWISRRPASLPQLRFYREYRNYDNQWSLRDIHFAWQAEMSQPPRSAFGELWNCANRTIMAGWSFPSYWEAVRMEFKLDNRTYTMFVVCLESTHGPSMILVDSEDNLGQQIMDAGRNRDNDLSDSFSAWRTFTQRWRDMGSRTELTTADRRWKIQAFTSDIIIPGISPDRAVASIKFRFQPLENPNLNAWQRISRTLSDRSANAPDPTTSNASAEGMREAIPRHW